MTNIPSIHNPSSNPNGIDSQKLFYQHNFPHFPKIFHILLTDSYNNDIWWVLYYNPEYDMFTIRHL